MPTGYTADIAKDITFKQFAMNCARAFGACITLRDEVGGGEIIPERFEPSDYHLKQQEKYRAELNDLESMAPEEIVRAMLDDYEARETNRRRYLQDSVTLQEKYESMLAQVLAWKVPSDLVALRSFMTDQIQKSIDFDCDSSYYAKPTPKETPEAWKARRLQEVEQSLGYHIKGHAEEVARVEERNRWLKLLRDSLQD